MAAKKSKKKGHGIKVIDGAEPVEIIDPRVAKKAKSLESAVTALAKPREKRTAVVSVEGVEWGVRVKDGERVASAGRGDRVAEELAQCVDVESLVSFASEFLPREKVNGYLDRAPNFGQFRMVIGNCIRGAISRAERERQKAAKAGK